MNMLNLFHSAVIAIQVVSSFCYCAQYCYEHSCVSAFVCTHENFFWVLKSRVA